MFSSDGFLTEKFSSKGPSQTHVFSAFPNSAVDLDEDSSPDGHSSGSNAQAYGYQPSNTQQSALPLPATSSPAKDEPLHVWQIEYYQKYFQVDTAQVRERLLASMMPRLHSSYFNSTMRENPDLYGPFWVCVTFIVTVAISGNILTYLRTSGTDFPIDFSKITLSAILVFFYWWSMPACIHFFFRWHLQRVEYTFVELLCIYGYSLTIFIPVSILWMILIAWLQWLLTLVASLISASVLVVTFWPTVNSDVKRYNGLAIAAVLLAHLLMAVGIMLVFFHVSDKNILVSSSSSSTVAVTSKSTV